MATTPGEVTVSLPEADAVAQLTVYRKDGAAVLTSDVIGSKTVSLSALQKGIYLFRVSGEQGEYSFSTWLMVYDDTYPYVAFSASAKSTSDKIKDLDPLCLPDEISYAFSLQHIGLFQSFSLYPSDGVNSTLAS
ncbi:T9SS type A sorting domain-containing protein [Salmonella enterica]|nr:T9SS type A sorting domain-containing protein [Salmonella enterica]